MDLKAEDAPVAVQSDDPPAARHAPRPVTQQGRFSFRGRFLLSVILVILFLMIGVSLFGWLATLKEPPVQRPLANRVYNVEVFDVRQTTLTEIISAFGTARSDRETVHAAKVAGEVLYVHPRLEVGETVHALETSEDSAGESRRLEPDLLVTIDPRTYRERVTQAESRIAEAEAELARIDQEEKNNTRLVEKMQADYEDYLSEFNRIKGLRERGVTSPSDLTRAKLQLSQYESELIRFENERSLFPRRREAIHKRLETNRIDQTIAEIELGHTDVYSAFSGILKEVRIEEGQYVRPGDPLFTVTDVNTVEIPIPVSLDDYAKIVSLMQKGKRPDVELAENETAPHRWTGYVDRVAPVADELTRTVMIYVHVDNRKQRVPLLPGTFVHARISGPDLVGTIVVPRDAILNGKLFVVKNSAVVERQPVLMRTLRSLAVVESGVDDGDEVVLTNLDVVYEGAAVKVQSHRTLQEELNRHRVQVARFPSETGQSSEPIRSGE